MTQLTIVTEDNMVGVDGLFIELDLNLPDDVWAVQWNGTEGVAELKDGTTRPVEATEAQGYIDSYNVASNAAYEANKEAQLATDPADQARLERDSKIAETDWWVLPDRTPTQAQLDYRQALRDLPASADWNPSWVWNDNDADRAFHYTELAGVNWPVKP